MSTGPPRKPRYRAFHLRLYPDNPNHQKFMEYIRLKESIFRWASILHDRDTFDEDDEAVQNGTRKIGELKESHIHFLVKTKEQWTVDGFLKFFNGWIDFVIGVESVTTTLLYFLHDTPNSMHKAHYSFVERMGDDDLWKMAIIQNTNFEYLKTLVNICEQIEHCTFTQVVRAVEETYNNGLISWFMCNASFVRMIVDEHKQFTINNVNNVTQVEWERGNFNG